MFDCIMCGIRLSSNQRLKSHKENCKGTMANQCELCLKLFANSSARHRHEKNKVCERNGTMITNSQNSISSSHNTTTHTDSHNTTINIQPQITINKFGYDNTEYLYKNPDFLRRCIFQDLKGILELIKRKNFNKNHPENKNIQKNKAEYNFLRTFNGRDWIPELTEGVIDTLVRSVSNILDNQIEIDLDGDEDNNIPRKNGREREHYINRLQNYLNLLKAVDIPIDQEYIRNSTNTKIFKKNDIYKVVDEFIKIHSDGDELQYYKDLTAHLRKKIKELEQ